MKVVHIIEPTLGGTRKYILDLLNGLQNKDLELYLLFGSERADEQFWEGLKNLSNIEKHEIDKFGRGIDLRKDLSVYKQIKKHLERIKPDIVHTHSSKAGALGRVAAKRISNRILTIYTPHGIAVNMGKKYWFIEKILSLYTDILLAVSENEKRYLSNLNLIDTSKLRHINNGIDIEQQADKINFPLKEQFGKQTDFIIGTIGRISKAKNPALFVNVVKELISYNDKLRFVWVGDGELRNFLENSLKRNSLSKYCYITGWVDDVRPHLQDFDVFISTSKYESFGYVMAEANIFCKPVVATKNPGSLSIIQNKKNGLLVEHSAKIISDSIKYLIENKSIRERMGKEGKKIIINNFSLRNMVDKYCELYNDILYIN